MNDVIYRKVMTVPEAGAQLGLGRNASYAAAKRGDIGRRLDSGASLLPPALIIQDELHLISGPLGTVRASIGLVEGGKRPHALGPKTGPKPDRTRQYRTTQLEG